MVRGRWGIRELEWEARGQGGEKGEKLGKREGRSARRTEKGGGRQGAGRGGKEVDGENPPPPSTTLFIPLGKSTNAKIFRVVADFNPRRQYIGIYLYFELLFIPKSGLQCHQVSKHLQCIQCMYIVCSP